MNLPSGELILACCAVVVSTMSAILGIAKSARLKKRASPPMLIKVTDASGGTTEFLVDYEDGDHLRRRFRDLRPREVDPPSIRWASH